MSTHKIIIQLTILAVTLLISCEKEKTEYNQFGDSDFFFFGFSDIYSNILIHDESISYYSQKSNKVFDNLFEYRNGRKLGKGIHSYKTVRLDHYNKIIGIITVEDENKVEIVDARNFLSIKQITLERPRDITITYDGVIANIFISCGGNSNNGKLVLIQVGNYDVNNKYEIAKEILTGNNPGKIFIQDYYIQDYIYVFPNEKDGGNTIAKIYHQDFNPFSFQKVESIYVGEKPVSFESFYERFTGHSNMSLAILCKGTFTIPASIVHFDLVLNKVINEYSFKTLDLQPENIVRLIYYYTASENDEIWFNANNKIFKAKLSQLEKPDLVLNRNISDFTRTDYPQLGGDVYLAVSRDTINLKSNLYLLKLDPITILDSITINGHAKKIISSF